MNKILEELVTVSKGKKAQAVFTNNIPASVRYIQIEDLRTDTKLQYTTDKNGTFVSEDDVCIAWDGANAGTIGYGLNGLIGSTIARLRFKEFYKDKIHTPYIGRFLQSKFSFLNGKTTGTTIPHIEKSRLDNLLISIPSLEEQRRIAAILDKAEAIHHKRQKALKMADDFLKSVFLDMFGDPVINPMKWKSVALTTIAEVVSGVTKGKRYSDPNLIRVPYMRVANVQDGHILLNEIKEIDVLKAEAERYKLLPQDILLTEGGDPDKLGRGAIWHGEIKNCIHQNHIFRVRLVSDMVLPEYLSALLGSSYGKRYFLQAAKQTTGIASINKTQLSEFPVLMPDRALQQQYENFCLAHAIFRSKLQCESTKVLSASLLNEFFH